MIDIHSHILYDIDDGSESLDMSLQMLRMSVDSGVTDIIATPHVNRRGHIPSWQTILDKAAALQDEADKAQIPIRIHTGAEVELNGDTLRFMKENHDDYCMAGSRYVMLELTDQSQPDIVEKMIYELQMRGFLPLLAHVERYERLMERPETLLAWMNKGVLAQCNTGSFTGYFGSKLQQRVRDLYRNGMIHFLGSDGHRVEFRTTDIREAHEELDRLAAKDKPHVNLWNTATRNAECILKNRVFYPDLPSHWQKEKKGFFHRLFG